MAQHSSVAAEPIRYSRADFAALRAWVQRVPVERIAQSYYADDAPQVAAGLKNWLESMRQDLIERAILANPAFAEMLAKARIGGAMSVGVLNVLIKVGEANPLPPSPSDHIGHWFRRKVATQLLGQGVKTLSELKALIERRGYTWWHSIPRIGALRAAAVVAWLNRHQALRISAESQIPALPDAHRVALTTSPVPLERIHALPSYLDGSQGINRAKEFSYLQAKDDLQAIRAYLSGYRDQPHTLRSYQRELERLLLWSVLVLRKPLSSLLVQDCEAYKDFLKDPLKEVDALHRVSFIGPRRPRNSPHWRPFAGEERNGVVVPQPLSPASQRQAIQIIRTAFNFFTATRYLGGNPWLAVKDPRTPKMANPMQIERALRADLWQRAVTVLDRLCADPAQKQARAGRAAIMLMGACGLRSSEGAGARMKDLEFSQFARVSQLTVFGKRDKVRVVPVSARVLAAFRAHWGDWGVPGPSPSDSILSGTTCLVRPLNRPLTEASHRRSRDAGEGYAPGAFARIAKTTFAQIAQADDFDPGERELIIRARAHDLRHTFATLAVQDGMPIDVVQHILGHESLATTSIYVQAQQRRIAQEAEKLFLAQERQQSALLSSTKSSTESVDNIVENAS
jgi:site-specific recombinase XerD